MTVKTDNNNISKKLTGSIVILIVLSLCLSLTTFALVYSTLIIEDNIFSTGEVKINLNDGNPVIEAGEFAFEPGVTVQKPFFIKNNSTCEVYYKIYFENVSGGLADVLEITVSDGDDILAQGKAKELTKKAVSAAKETLDINEERTLKITFHYPRNAGNDTQDQVLEFDLYASAVQVKNNPNKDFE